MERAIVCPCISCEGILAYEVMMKLDWIGLRAYQSVAGV